MKHALSLIVCVTIYSAMMVSCGNNKKSQEPTQEGALEQKQEVADSVLAIVDAFEIDFANLADKGIKIHELFVLTEEEKLVKPDFLLDPSEAEKFVTRSQKVNALAYFMTEYPVRVAYEMPLEDVNEVIAKLAAEVNFGLDVDYIRSDAPNSEKISKIYEYCKETGDLGFFWQYQCALIFHTDYIIACNPELFIPKVSEERLKQFNLKLEYVTNAAAALAPYDPEMAELYKEIKTWDLLVEESDWDEAFATESSTASFYIDNKAAITERRNRMLK